MKANNWAHIHSTAQASYNVFISPYDVFLSFSFFFYYLFLLKDNCFTEFCCFLSNLNMNQPQVYLYPLLSETPISLPIPPSRLIQSPSLSFLSHTANSCWLSILHMVIRFRLFFPYISPSPPLSPCL